MSLKGFNLLQDATVPPDAWDKVYEWVTKVGRVLVMVVELIVVIAFVSRIVIDTQTKELQKQNDAYSKILAASQTNELHYRDYQKRFESYKTLWNNASSYEKIVSDIVKLTPSNIDNLAISIKDQVINFKGKAPISQVKNLETSLKSSQYFSRVLVPEISTEAQTSSNVEVEFNIRIELKPEAIHARTQI